MAGSVELSPRAIRLTPAEREALARLARRRKQHLYRFTETVLRDYARAVSAGQIRDIALPKRHRGESKGTLRVSDDVFDELRALARSDLDYVPFTSAGELAAAALLRELDRNGFSPTPRERTLFDRQASLGTA